VFLEGSDDFGMRDVVAEHAIDHVAFEVREARDFSVASELPGYSGSRGMFGGGGTIAMASRGWQRWWREHGQLRGSGFWLRRDANL
jgi:hypothetical protein